MSARASTLPHARAPMASATGCPSRPTRKVVGRPNNAVCPGNLTLGVQNERKGQVEIPGILLHMLCALTEVDAQNRESLCRKILVQALNSGISGRHSAHHEAQKFTSTTRPWKSVSDTAWPVTVCAVKGGGHRPGG